MRFRGKRITLLVTGSIAAYKSAELTREYVKLGAHVSVVMSRSAEQFITPLTLQTLSGRPVMTSLFDLQQESEIGHIRLANDADVVVVAPATADLIARARFGNADDPVCAVLLATRAPVLIAPAMNLHMWEHAATQENVQMLRARGVHVVEPGEGELACGWQGRGRLAEIEEIVRATAELFSSGDLSGRHVVVTAGPTREAIDPVRFISNRSSGKMGYALAERARDRGASVTLISGPTSLPVPDGVEFVYVNTAREMESALKSAFQPKGPGMLVMAAAVTDFRPATAHESKLKEDKLKATSLALEPNPDILAGVGLSRPAGYTIVGFCAESGDDKRLLAEAKRKLGAKRADLIVANRIEEAFEGEEARVWLVREKGVPREVACAAKRQIADEILSAALECSTR